MNGGLIVIKAPILIVEDNEQDIALYDKLLGSAYFLLVARTVEEAKLYVRCSDLVILDMKLPDGTGEDLLDYMEKIECLIPVIAISGFHIYEPAVIGRVIRWLDKPIDTGRLACIVEDLLTVSRAIRGLQDCDTRLTEF